MIYCSNFIVSGTEKIWEIYTVPVLLIFHVKASVYVLPVSKTYVLPSIGNFQYPRTPRGFPGGSVTSRESACSAGELDSVPGLGRATHSSIQPGKPMNRGQREPRSSWGCKSGTRLSNKTTISSKILALHMPRPPHIWTPVQHNLHLISDTSHSFSRI